MIKRKTTTTLWYDEANPSMSVYPGHIGVREFNRLHTAEGWKGDRVYKDQINHGYLVKNKKRGRVYFSKAQKDTPGAKPFTIMDW